MTPNVETKLKHLLTNTHKAEMVAYLKAHPEDFTEAIQLTLANEQPYSWRASWVLWSCMDQNDKRVRKYVRKIIDILPHRKDNQQRELLMILQRMKIHERDEGPLFDAGVKIWEQIGKMPSLRYNAFKTMVSIANQHPELSQEIWALTEAYYTDSLSAGIKNSLFKWIKDLPKTTPSPS